MKVTLNYSSKSQQKEKSNWNNFFLEKMLNYMQTLINKGMNDLLWSKAL